MRHLDVERGLPCPAVIGRRWRAGGGDDLEVAAGERLDAGRGEEGIGVGQGSRVAIGVDDHDSLAGAVEAELIGLAHAVMSAICFGV